MIQGYENFCMADPLFYDALHSERSAGESFATVRRSLPEGWSRKEQDDWFTFQNTSGSLPAQGWKIHVSACPDNATRILEAVWDYCVPRGIEFKFLRSPSALISRLSKYAPRGYSGKLVTIYPPDDTACEQILHELGGRLEGEPSPYILTDLRWGRGPLYVRYGAFAMRYCVDEDGRIVPAVADPSGTLVPDRRDPVFTVPPWVRLPAFLEPHLAARNAVSVAGLPYSIERVVHFSNGGGIYVGKDTRTGGDVVLKEARPHSGLDAWGHDAVRRVEREHSVLRRLSGVPGVPEAYDLFWVGEHRFLAMEYIDATPLSRAVVQRYPLIDPAAGEREYAGFTDWALGLYDQIETTMREIHRRGIVYGDLHLFNIMVRDDDTIALLDYEVASPVEDATPPGLGNQGFTAPPGTTGFDVDRYALACLRLALFLPMTTVLWLHRPKARHFARIIADHFPVPDGYLDQAARLIAGEDEEGDQGTGATARHGSRPSAARGTGDGRAAFDPADWPALRAAMTRAIVASATPERDDRLFPGDIEQFAVGGLGLAYGTAGVLYALSVTGAGRFPEYEEWLLRQAKRPPSDTRPGLFDGLHGTAFALDHLGHREAALDALDLCLHGDWASLGLDLAGGLAGVGLNLAHFAERTGDTGLRAAAARAAALVAERLDDSLAETEPAWDGSIGDGSMGDGSIGDGSIGDGGPISGGEHPSAGLLRGMAGPALLLIRAYDDTGDRSYLEQAARALRHDLRRCVVRENGALEVNEGWRTMPYLDVGSAGIGMVLDEYLARCPDDGFAMASRQVERAAQAEMYILPGLFSGRAGILLYLAARADREARRAPAVERQIRGLDWHALPYGGGVAFPGTALLRLSMDLATGTAGVLLALGAALHAEPVHLPLLAHRLPRFPARVR